MVDTAPKKRKYSEVAKHHKRRSAGGEEPTCCVNVVFTVKTSFAYNLHIKCITLKFICWCYYMSTILILSHIILVFISRRMPTARLWIWGSDSQPPPPGLNAFLNSSLQSTSMPSSTRGSVETAGHAAAMGARPDEALNRGGVRTTKYRLLVC